MDASGSYVTNQQGDSPLDDDILEDGPVGNDGQDDNCDLIKKRQQNRKRKRKNQSLREMVIYIICCLLHTYTHTHTYTSSLKSSTTIKS